MSHTHQDSGNEMTFTEKSTKRLSHWIHHNEDHAQNYRQWANEFDRHQLPAVKQLLESAAELSDQINIVLKQALELLPAEKDQA